MNLRCLCLSLLYQSLNTHIYVSTVWYLSSPCVWLRLKYASQTVRSWCPYCPSIIQLLKCNDHPGFWNPSFKQSLFGTQFGERKNFRMHGFLMMYVCFDDGILSQKIINVSRWINVMDIQQLVLSKVTSKILTGVNMFCSLTGLAIFYELNSSSVVTEHHPRFNSHIKFLGENAKKQEFLGTKKERI